MKIGMAMDYDDIFQELSVVFIKAYDGFDESKGQFSTYFTWAAYNRVNVMAKRHENSIEFTARSVDEIATWGDGDNDMNIGDLIPAGDGTPEQITEATQAFRQFASRLSPLAARMVELAIDPPACFDLELEAAAAHAEEGRASGRPSRCKRQSINLSFIGHVLVKAGVNERDVGNARKEVVKLASRSFTA